MIEQLRKFLDDAWPDREPTSFERITLLALIHLIDQGNTMASGMDHLRSADANLATAVAATLAYISQQAATLTDPDADVDAVAGDIQAKADALNATLANPSGAPPTPAPPPAPVVTISGDTSGAVGATVQLTGSSNDGAAVTWASSDATIATVDVTGLVTGVAAGSVTITATNPTGQSATASVSFS